jgi:methyl-accepting chemotaxis protein WspA
MGKRISKKMRATVHGITTAVEGISQKLAALNQQAASIGGVVVTIAKVADQTNLLSLNAAIEAEKAGEYGHGFAVVAREIRRLADQTGASTTDIEKMVREIQGGVSAGVMAMEKFAHEVQRGASEIEDSSGVFSEIIQQIHALTPTFVTVSEGMDLQAKSALQITESLGQLSSAARQTADSLAQSNQSIEQLHQATLLMQGEVDKFKVDGVQ